MKEYILITAKGSVLQTLLQRWAITIVAFDDNGFPSVEEIREFSDLATAKFWALTQFENVYKYGEYTLPFPLFNMNGFSKPAFYAEEFSKYLVKIKN